MNKLLKLEYRRLFMSKALYICTAISLVMLLISAFTSKLLYEALSTIEPEDMEGMAQLGVTALDLPTSLSLLKGIGSSSLTLILAVFIALFVTEEYTGDIIKNVYAKGYSRDLVFFSKYLSSLTGSLFIVLVDAVFSIILGKALFGEFGTMGKNYVSSFIAILFLIVSYDTLYFAISIAMRKTGGSIAISIFGPIVINLLLNLGNAISKSETVDLTEYWIAGRLTILSYAEVSNKAVWMSFLIGGIYLLAFGAAGFFLNRKRES